MTRVAKKDRRLLTQLEALDELDDARSRFRVERRRFIRWSLLALPLGVWSIAEGELGFALFLVALIVLIPVGRLGAAASDVWEAELRVRETSGT